MWRVLPARPLCVKFACKLIKIEGYSVRLMRARRSLDNSRIERYFAHQREFGRIIEPLQGGIGKAQAARYSIGRKLRQHLARIPKHRFAARVPVLNIEHGIVARLLDHLGKIEVERR